MKKPTLQELTLREKIGQTAVALVKISKGDPAYFKDHPYGAVWSSHWMTRRDPEVIAQFKANGYDIGDLAHYEETYANWTKAVNQYMRIPLISPLDAEAGIAAEFPNATFTVSATCSGAANDEELLFDLGHQVAKQALAGGCHWIWGPVADNPSMFCGAMTLRSYSYDVEHISRMIQAQIRGMQSAGVAATAKHFPGVDRHEYRDAHFQPSQINYSLEEWEREQAPSFQAAIDAGVCSVMAGHGAFPAVDDRMEDGTYIPATLSEKIITGLLKEKMGFKGVVVTDGINMRGLTAFYTGAKLYVELLRAGNDMLLGVEEDYLDAVEAAVLSGDLPESRIDDACQRVLDMKEKLGMFREDHVFGGGITEEMKQAIQVTNRKIAEKGVTLVADKTNMLPLDKNKIKKVLMRYDGYGNGEALLEAFAAQFRKRGATVDFLRDGQLPPEDAAAPAFAKLTPQYDLIVYIGAVGGHSPMGWPAFSGEKCEPFYRWILTSGKEKSIGIAPSYPFMYYNYYLNCPVFINTLGSSRDNIEVCVDGLYGDITLNTHSTIPVKPEF